MQVGVTFSEFKLRLQKENEVFDRQIQVQDDLIAVLHPPKPRTSKTSSSPCSPAWKSATPASLR